MALEAFARTAGYLGVEPVGKSLNTAAHDILIRNDRGGFTVPTEGLYPYQWNWDSVFVALGFATVDLDRAWRELESLFEGQWADGMVPHILFRTNDPRYFPGPDVWQTSQAAGHGPFPTSGISQPPVAAIAVRALLEQEPGEGNAGRALALFPKLMAWHRWWLTYRDPSGDGAIAIVHPWESGRDNLPDWDEPLALVETAQVEPYERKDTSHVDASMRPQRLDYDRYMAILQAGRAVGWDARKVVDASPFLVADPSMTMILLRACKDLLALAQHLGLSGVQPEISDWIDRLEKGARSLWNDQIQAFTTRNLRSGVQGSGVSSATFLAPFAGITDETYRVPTLAHFDRIADRVTYTVPSYDPDHPGFEHMRYWRGPVWGVVNYMIARGFAETGETLRAERIRNDTARLIETSGFAEYFSPLDGAGAGGRSFSWTAAVWLAWVAPDRAGAVE